MEDNFKIIVITPDRICRDEAQRITALLESGAVWRVHIRHPQASAADVAKILCEIEPRLYERISLHDCYALTSDFAGVGVHLNARNTAPVGGAALLSKSCHTLGEVMCSECDYVTLSPIYNSISKAGYMSAFDLKDNNLRKILSTRQVIALGGVTPERFAELRSAGFAGAALLGYVWQTDDDEFKNRIDKIYATIHN